MRKLFHNILRLVNRDKTPTVQYLREDQIVEDIFRNMSEDGKQALRDIKVSSLIGLHHTTGRWIRNEYRLWDTKNPYVDSSDVNAPNFPDQMSQRIIEKIWQKVTTTPPSRS